MKKTKWLALLLCLVMVCSLVACGSKENKNDSKTPTNTNDSETNQDSEKDKTDDVEDSDNQGDASDTGNENANGLPLAETVEELSFWISRDYQYLDDINDMSSIQELEKRTNVHINWNIVSSNEASEKFGLMLASGSIPDMVRMNNVTYPGGLEKSVDDGLFLDVTDLVDQYMPAYKGWLNSDPTLAKGTKTDSGRLVGIYTLNGDNDGMGKEMAWDGILVRKDWLDQMNMEVPETIEEWHAALKGFKEQFGAEAPLMIGSDGTMLFGAFMTAYGILPEFFQVDGTVKFGPAEPGYKDYVQMMRDWYAEGLIDPNFMTNDAKIAASNDYMGTGKAGAGASLWGYAADLLNTDYHFNDDENFYLIGAKNPVLTKGAKSYSGYNGSAIGSPIIISATSKNPELACRWLDYLYTEEGMILNQYGIEGVTYTEDENGYHFTDWILKGDNEVGIVGSDAYHYHMLGTASFGWYNWGRFFSMFEGNDEAMMCSQPVWDQDSTEWVIPAQVSMTELEGNEYNSLYTAIGTLVDEQTVRYIMGSESMDTWDKFMADLESYDLQRCIDIQQAALDRYNAR